MKLDKEQNKETLYQRGKEDDRSALEKATEVLAKGKVLIKYSAKKITI